MTTRWRCSRQKLKGGNEEKKQKAGHERTARYREGVPNLYDMARIGEYEEGDGNKETKSRMTPPLLAWREQERGYIRS